MMKAGRCVRPSSFTGAWPSGDPAERLKRLKELKDAGLITEQEYATRKAEILSEM
ncbi:MAG: SHOCT domain-containing protein [Pyrinomonadaceae bacterium]